MAFPDRMVLKIMNCVTSVRFQILINGEPSKVFKPSQGIRQGDPLSLFLFVLRSEDFSALIGRAEQAGLWTSLPFRPLSLCPTFSLRMTVYGFSRHHWIEWIC